MVIFICYVAIPLKTMGSYKKVNSLAVTKYLGLCYYESIRWSD